MLRKEMTKVEIEKELAGKGDYVLIDNITRFLKENVPVDLKRFVSLKLIEIYERRAMFADAAEIYNRLVEIAMTDADKVKWLTKSAESYVKAGFLDRADLSMKKALSEAKPMEKSGVITAIKDCYRKQAIVYEKEKRRSKAIQIYEKMLSMEFSTPEKDEINQKLLPLYKEMGMVERYMQKGGK